MISRIILVIVRNLEIHFLQNFLLLTKRVCGKIWSFSMSALKVRKNTKMNFLNQIIQNPFYKYWSGREILVRYWSGRETSVRILIRPGHISQYNNQAGIYQSYYWSDREISVRILIRQRDISQNTDQAGRYQSEYWSGREISVRILIRQRYIS